MLNKVINLLSQVRIVKWTCGYDVNSTELYISKHLHFSKGLYDGFQFSVSGLGLSKWEREVFNAKFLVPSEIINIYLGKLIISINKSDSIEEQLRTVTVYCNKPLHKYIESKFKYMMNILKDKFYHLKFKTQHDFELVRSFEGSCRFKSDVLSAFQLANNYEADLYLNGHLIFSPLAFDWNENAKLIKKYLGKSFVKPDRWDLKGYKDFSDVELVK